MIELVPQNITVQFEVTVPVEQRYELLAELHLVPSSGSDHLAVYHVQADKGKEADLVISLAWMEGVLFAGRETDTGTVPYPVRKC